MERFSVIVVADETAPIRRFDVRRVVVRRAIWCAGAVAVLLLALCVDYVRVRIDQREMDALRVETSEQKARIAAFDETVSGVQATLDQVREFERKVRTIANLPGSAAAGGAAVVEVGPSGGGDLEARKLAPGETLGIPTTGPDASLPNAGAAQRASGKAGAASEDDRISALRDEARRLGLVAEQRQLSLQELVAELEDKHQRLASSPAVWPTEGWLTSRFGTRISPFTGKRQFHAGIDVAGAAGTDVVATAAGKVTFAGRKGPLGNAVTIDHGHGIRSHYGHNEKLMVKRGERVVRGQKIATLGNTGRSTGPHLHYGVEVQGRSVNPLDYIFD